MMTQYLFGAGRCQVNVLLFLRAGVFLIPYFLMLVFCGIPLFVLEAAIGQFCSQGSINVWRAVPIMQGELLTGKLHIHSHTFSLQPYRQSVILQVWASLPSRWPRWCPSTTMSSSPTASTTCSPPSSFRCPGPPAPARLKPFATARLQVFVLACL